MHWGLNIFSPSLVQDDISFKVEHDGQEYEVKISWTKGISEKDPEIYSFMKIFFNGIMRRMDFEKVGRRGDFINPKKATNLGALQIWPGFFTALQSLDGGPVIQIETTNKVIRKDTLLATLNKMKSKSPDDIQKELKGMSVATTYGTNKHQYRIESINFDKTCHDKFELTKEKREVTFAEYFKEKYEAKITDMNQPLVVTKDSKTGREIFLVPELCNMTGLTDDHRKDFNLMRNMGQILHKGAEDRKKEMEILMTEIQGQTKIKELCDKWKINIGHEPVKIEGQRINGGQIQMGKNNSFPADCSANDFDRKIQAPMLKQIGLQRWAIIHGRNDKRHAESFSQNIK